MGHGERGWKGIWMDEAMKQKRGEGYHRPETWGCVKELLDGKEWEMDVK